MNKQTNRQKSTYRQEMAENTKKLILQTAIRLFRKHGYANVTVSDIVKTAKISRGSFYVHYKNKDDILCESLFVDLDEQYLSFYQAVLLGPEYSNKNSLELLAIFLLKVNQVFTKHGPELLRYYYSYCLCHPHLLMSENRHYLKIIRELIAKSRCGELLSDVYSDEQLLEMCLIINRGIAMQWAIKDGEYPIEGQNELIDKFIITIKR